ncbi:MAG: hypothetical protein R2795_02950 [Saprospiraceae bacterium]
MMNTLTVNLHLLMVSFYRPSPQRYKILIEADAFPSDRCTLASQLRFHGYDPDTALIALKARPGEECIRIEDIQEVLATQGSTCSIVGNTNYYTGQFSYENHLK